MHCGPGAYRRQIPARRNTPVSSGRTPEVQACQCQTDQGQYLNRQAESQARCDLKTD